MKKLLLLILLFCFSQADAQVRRADIIAIGSVDSIQLDGRWLNLGSLNDSTAGRNNVFTGLNTFERYITAEEYIIADQVISTSFNHTINNNGNWLLKTSTDTLINADTNYITLGKPIKYLNSAVNGGYKEYTALISQTGTNNPTIIELVNTTGTTVTTERTDVGQYTLTFDGAVLISGKVYHDIDNGYLNSGQGTNIGMLYTSTTVMTVNTATIDGTTGIVSQTDGVLSNTPLILKIYN